jgi:imidazolonepropionase
LAELEWFSREIKKDKVHKTTIDLLIIHAAQVVTPGRGWKLHVIKDGAVAIAGEKIAAVGPTRDLLERFESREIIDATGKLVCPGFVDSHTHVIYTGYRAREFALRLQGMPYMEIARRGGGINSTVRATRKATVEGLVASAEERLARMLAWGTTTVEVKSGYGLTIPSEIKMLDVARKLSLSQPVEIVPTFMGAHEVPPEFKDRRDEYIDLIIENMIPEVGSRGLAAFCDVFTEAGVFTVDESRRILLRAQDYGMAPKIHADEITPLGGAELAAEVKAASADHLVYVSPDGIAAMKKAGVVPVLLPGTSFFLRSDYAPARDMINAGLPVALATDNNPGTCLLEGMPLVMGLACLEMKMTPEEAIIASTLNAAKAIRRDGNIGSLDAGKQADILMLGVADFREIPYRFGTNTVQMVIKKGKIAVSR